MDTFWTHWLETVLVFRVNYLKVGAPGGIRTPNPQIRSLMLCPVELQAPMEHGRLLKIDDL
jgi:hypothetical protein